MTTTASAVILIPLQITGGMIKAGTTVSVVNSGEVAWDGVTDFAAGTERVNYEGSLYTAIAASTNIRPGTDAAKWRRTGPSNRMAPFDDKLNTSAKALGSLTYVIQPGFFTGIAMYGLRGDQIHITLYDEPGGNVIDSYTGDLWEQARGLYEYLFMPLRALTKWQRQDLELYPNAELRITVSNNDPEREVAVGEIVCGHWATLLGSGDLGGVEYGADAEIKTYTYFHENDDGSVEITPRHSATNVNCSVVVDAEQANNAFELLHSIANRPVAIIASGLPRYDYLNTYGLVSATVTAENWPTAKINLKVRGYI